MDKKLTPKQIEKLKKDNEKLQQQIYVLADKIKANKEIVEQYESYPTKEEYKALISFLKDGLNKVFLDNYGNTNCEMYHWYVIYRNILDKGYDEFKETKNIACQAIMICLGQDSYNIEENEVIRITSPKDLTPSSIGDLFADIDKCVKKTKDIIKQGMCKDEMHG